MDQQRGDEESILLQPYKYLAETPGKDVRGKLATAFNR